MKAAKTVRQKARWVWRGRSKLCFGEMAIRRAENEAEARRIAHEYWPNVAIAGELSQAPPIPSQFEHSGKFDHERRKLYEVPQMG